MNILYYSIVFIFGLVVGSFLNSVIYRLSLPDFTFWGSLVKTRRSYCPNCQHILNWRDLIPIFSHFVLRGKCRYCGKPISIQYPIVEVLTGLIFLLIIYNFKFLISNQFQITQFINVLFLFYISSSLIVIFISDLKHYLIPDQVLFPAIVVTFVYRLFENWNLGFGISAPFIWYLVPAFLAFGFFYIIFSVSRGGWMGFGDCKLAVLLGLLLGFPGILLAVFLAFFFGAIISLGAILVSLFLVKRPKLGLKSQIPFAPFLIAGTFITMFFGSSIINWYLGLFVL